MLTGFAGVPLTMGMFVVFASFDNRLFFVVRLLDMALRPVQVAHGFGAFGLFE